MDKRQARRKALMKSTEKEKGGFGKPLYPNTRQWIADGLDCWLFSPPDRISPKGRSRFFCKGKRK